MALAMLICYDLLGTMVGYGGETRSDQLDRDDCHRHPGTRKEKGAYFCEVQGLSFGHHHDLSQFWHPNLALPC